MDPANTSSMRNLSIFATLLFCALAANSYAQNQIVWTAANSETIPLEPASLHAGRAYHPAVGGGDMHVQIDSRYPVTVAMAWADEWNAAMRPGAPGNFSFLCAKEHVTSAIYECHLPSDRPMIITFRDDHGPIGGKMALINRAGDMLLRAEEAEIPRGSGAHGGIPFIGPSHGHGDRISGVDLHMHVAAPDSGTVDAAGVQAGGLQKDGLAVGGSPDKLILRIRVRGQGAEQQRGENRKVPHTRSIGWVHARTLANWREEDYEGTKFR